MSPTYTYCHAGLSEYLRENNLEPARDKTAAAAQAAGDARRRMESFLAAVEQKAFVMARIALRHDDDAHDVVQDSMIRLVRKYADRPETEWKPLFYRILKNRIVDQQRRGNVRQRVMAWLPLGEDAPDPIAEAPGLHSDRPDRQLELDESMARRSVRFGVGRCLPPSRSLVNTITRI